MNIFRLVNLFLFILSYFKLKNVSLNKETLNEKQSVTRVSATYYNHCGPKKKYNCNCYYSFSL